jgi:hypothetical protein
MRKIALLAALAFAASFMGPSTSAFAQADPLYSLNKNGFDFVRDAWNPYAASSKAAAPAKAARKGKKK